jgi:hypothetical protein
VLNQNPDQALEEFVLNIVKNLAKSGFPRNRVALPLERMYEVAHGKGLNFNKALDRLAERGITHEKTNEKIIFFAAPQFGDMMAEAQKIFASMTDEQRAELLKNFTPPT